jgi:hypothetical protein
MTVCGETDEILRAQLLLYVLIIIIIIIIVINGTIAFCEPWPFSGFNFYGVRLSASSQTPNLENQGIPLHLAPTPRPVRPGWPYQ